MKTTDLWFAAFLLYNGIKLIDYEILAVKKCRYTFDISKEDWKKYRLMFAQSESSKIKQYQSELKDMMY